jgi:hypothetical protein
MGRATPAYFPLVLLLWSSILLAQEIPIPGEPASQRADTLPQHNAASILFDRNLNTYNWIERASIDTSIGATRLQINHQFIANIIQIQSPAPSDAKKLESDQQNLSAVVGTPLARDLQGRIQWNSLIYTDEKGVGLSNASSHSVLGGFDIRPWPFLALDPMAGYRWDNQGGMRDRGVGYSLGAQLSEINMDGYLVDGSGLFHQDRLQPRLLENDFLQAGVQKSFTTETRDSLEVGFLRNRREFYSTGAGTIESRTENVFLFSNLIDYSIQRNIVATLYVGLNSRGLDKDFRPFGAGGIPPIQFGTRIDEMRLETFLQTAYRSDDGKTGTTLRLTYGERNETHAAKRTADNSPAAAVQFLERNRQEQTSDNLSRRTALSGQIFFPLSPSDAISLSGAANILRYDTPSELNLEDRDELLVALTLATSHRLSRVLDVGFSLDGTLSHLVYLLGERSANNNINRVLHLSSRSFYHPSDDLFFINAFEVLANYTVYDFEQQGGLVRSFSYRQFGWLDSTSIELTHTIGLDFFAYFKLYERGQLAWSEFTERLENTSADRTFAFQARFSPYARTVFAVGLRYFSQSRYEYDGEVKHLASFLSSFGPTCLVLWEIGPHSHLDLRGWYENRRQSDGSMSPIATMTMTITMNF